MSIFLSLFIKTFQAMVAFTLVQKQLFSSWQIILYILMIHRSRLLMVSCTQMYRQLFPLKPFIFLFKQKLNTSCFKSINPPIKIVKGFNGNSYLYICVQLTMSNLSLCIINMQRMIYHEENSYLCISVKATMA